MCVKCDIQYIPAVKRSMFSLDCVNEQVIYQQCFQTFRVLSPVVSAHLV